jgi:hypothetical protein
VVDPSPRYRSPFIGGLFYRFLPEPCADVRRQDVAAAITIDAWHSPVLNEALYFATPATQGLSDLPPFHVPGAMRVGIRFFIRSFGCWGGQSVAEPVPAAVALVSAPTSAVEGLLADLQPLTRLANGHPSREMTLGFTQLPNDLLRRMPLFLHLESPRPIAGPLRLS